MLKSYFLKITNFCVFVFGFHWAMAVSLIGLKKIDPSTGDTANPIPCDDFLPTSLTGSSAPNFNGPARRAAVVTENILQEKKNYFIIVFLFCYGNIAVQSISLIFRDI